MSSGRGRGYTGRHHLRETKPGEDPEDMNAARTLAELTPRSTAKTTVAMISEVKPDDEVDTSGDEEALQAMLKVDEQFASLLVLLEQFTPGEDGIQFNRKLRHFETSVTELCPDEARLQQAFATFRAAALQSSVTSRKLATVGAAFTRQQRQGMLRASLLNIMQATFTKLEVLERANPLYLINAANLMGDYFAEARLCNGKKVHILAGPLVQYMRSLLASDDIRAHRSLATQLMQNGRELLSILSQELDDLSISIRLRLLTPPPISIIWLLLSSDLCLNKFLPLPNTLQQFYASHLDLTSDENFSEVSYGSWKKENINLSIEDDTKPKLRPILGAGAGLLRQEHPDPSGEVDWKPSLTKRYDLNSWRQEEKEPTFNPNVPPPNYQEFPVYPENYYLQQGDGAYIQNMSVNVQTEKVNNEVQKSVDNYDPKFNEKRFEETNFNDKRHDDMRYEETNFNDKRSDDTKFNDKRGDDKKFDERSKNGSRQRLNRRNSGEMETRRHVSDVPRSHKYWDHDDRCDKDYNS
ncbi:uncharacterized protein LOC123718501 isoform X1 [Pieris brassicae]|uniref:uncharacterized protein LOC123718501 isoform X1 n=1 Tax=Pieris brassicae TaxID=7116 RepID=UPI001E6621CF|nr:uncharacterized protein LOC123718501 isoform X1 [Pieris brassicae]